MKWYTKGFILLFIILLISKLTGASFDHVSSIIGGLLLFIWVVSLIIVAIAKIIEFIIRLFKPTPPNQAKSVQINKK
jgi:hypothetical protein